MFTIIFYDFKITDVHNIIVFKWSVVLKRKEKAHSNHHDCSDHTGHPYGK